MVSVGLPFISAIPLGDLAPLSGGAFSMDQRNQRSGWALGWWACVLEKIGKPVMATHNGRLAPLTPDAGLFLPVLLPRVQAPASEIRHRNQSRGSVLSCGLAGPLEIVGYLSGSVCIRSSISFRRGWPELLAHGRHFDSTLPRKQQFVGAELGSRVDGQN